MNSALIKLCAGLLLALSAMTCLSVTPATAQHYYCRDGFDGYGRPCHEEWHQREEWRAHEEWRRHRDRPIIIERPAPVYIDRPRWVNCARENGFCRIPFPTRVRYGADGYFTFLDVEGHGIPCNNRVFGDPARGLRKTCWFLSR